jgi:hypothetical protein
MYLAKVSTCLPIHLNRGALHSGDQTNQELWHLWALAEVAAQSMKCSPKRHDPQPTYSSQLSARLGQIARLAGCSLRFQDVRELKVGLTLQFRREVLPQVAR